ncbi:MAG: DUF1868 domain-containing protein [Rudaea sp.]|uniref:DUF1868 domain-containing protein n=1 Tax=Rudaea sp. TaxID=2136325 RepID=UPI0039E3A4EA
MNPDRRSWLIRSALGVSATLAASRARADERAQCRSLPPAKPSEVGPGEKFAVDGKVQRFPGNTILCHVPRPGAAFDALCRACETLRAEVGSRHLSWLPEASYHATIFDCVTDAYRLPGDWPQMLPLDASMEQCNRYLAGRLHDFDLGFAPPLRFVVDDDVESCDVATLVPLRPIDAAENRRLRDLRDRLSRATGIRHANHDGYRFHSSFAYYVRQFTPAEEANYQLARARMLRRLRKEIAVLELDAPTFCVFDDMFAFHEQFRLRKT